MILPLFRAAILEPNLNLPRRHLNLVREFFSAGRVGGLGLALVDFFKDQGLEDRGGQPRSLVLTRVGFESRREASCPLVAVNRLMRVGEIAEIEGDSDPSLVNRICVWAQIGRTCVCVCTCRVRRSRRIASKMISNLWEGELAAPKNRFHLRHGYRMTPG